MSGAFLLVRDNYSGRAATACPPDSGGEAVAGWLHRSLSRQYDAVLAEELPLAMVALVEGAPGEH